MTEDGHTLAPVRIRTRSFGRELFAIRGNEVLARRQPSDAISPAIVGHAADFGVDQRAPARSRVTTPENPDRGIDEGITAAVENDAADGGSPRQRNHEIGQPRAGGDVKGAAVI